jgi:mRNA interferase MazF
MTMALTKLRCPRDPSHVHFRGEIRTFSRYEVELDADRNELRRANPTDFTDASEPSDERICCVTCDVEVWSKRRAITFFPSDGTVLLCDFSGGFRPPEMIEIRPTIVISKKATNRGSCVVVPISSRESRDDRAIVVPMQTAKYPFLRKDGWAKCHAPATISVTRLYLLRDAQTGRGLDTRGTMLDADDLAAVRNGVARFIGAMTPTT